MFFSDKRNRFKCLNTLMLCAFFLMTGCGPASSSGEKSQEPSETAAQPAAESVAQATGPVTETLWDKRADYEKEGQVVRFTDCGLYKGDTDELTGAKCEFKNGKWVLLEPKLEPKDNLIKNGDFSEWNEKISQPIHFFIWKSNSVEILLRRIDDDTISSPFSLMYETIKSKDKADNHISIAIDSDDLHKIKGKYVTLSCFIKSFETNNNSSMQLQLYETETWKIITPFISFSKSVDWERKTANIFIPSNINKLRIRMKFNGTGTYVFDNLFLYRGFFPMHLLDY